ADRLRVAGSWLVTPRRCKREPAERTAAQQGPPKIRCGLEYGVRYQSHASCVKSTELEKVGAWRTCGGDAAFVAAAQLGMRLMVSRATSVPHPAAYSTSAELGMRGYWMLPQALIALETIWRCR